MTISSGLPNGTPYARKAKTALPSVTSLSVAARPETNPVAGNGGQLGPELWPVPGSALCGNPCARPCPRPAPSIAIRIKSVSPARIANRISWSMIFSENRLPLLRVMLLGPIKPHWIVDQQTPLRCGARRDLRNIVDQDAVVGCFFFHIRVRPIGAPDDAIGEALDQCPAERHDVVI